MSKPEWRRWPWLSWCVVAATPIGCQSIVASGVSRPRLAVLLPMGHRDAELRQNFFQGFRLGQASVEACGEPFPQVAWHGTNSGDASDQQLMPLTQLKLLLAPPSADLRAFAAFADERDLTVLLPYQRGQSLDTLRGLEGRERLWPLVHSRQEDLKAMVAAAMEAGWGRAMVVEAPSALESTSSKAFVELFKAAGGIVESYESQPVQRVDPSNNGRLQRFKDDMAWSWVPTVVVADAPNGPLSRELRAEQQQGASAVVHRRRRTGFGSPRRKTCRTRPRCPGNSLGCSTQPVGRPGLSFNRTSSSPPARLHRCSRGRALMQLGSWLWPMQHACRCPLTGASMRWVGWTLIRRRSFRFARPLISVAAGSVCV